jgi:ferredoxin-NADP reductase
MPISIHESLYWLQDVSKHLRVWQRRKALRQPGKGFDYTQESGALRDLAAHLHPKQMRLSVVQVIQATPTAKTFHLERIDGPLPPFRAGQYINVFVEVDGIHTSRPYSIASQPGGNTIELTVKDNPGGFVAPYLIDELKEGDEVETSGPAGSFYHEALIDGNDLVFLAGGSGITPFMSIIREIFSHRRQIRVHLLYGSRTHDDVIYGDELQEMANQYSDFDYSLVISEPSPDYEGLTGFLEAATIREQVGDLEGKTFYVCGPPAMYDYCLTALSDLGIPQHKIKFERYGPPADVTQEPGWPKSLSAETIFRVDIVGRESIHALAGEPLMNSLERYGIVVPAICRVGECSACRVRLLSGRVFMPEDAGVRASDREHGYFHSCVAYPLEDLQIRLPR